MEIRKVFIVAFTDAERTAIENTIPWLENRSLPAAARMLTMIMKRYDDGEALADHDINQIQIWVKSRLGKSDWTEEMRKAAMR
jgi:uncharacterized protein (DUF1499 family)